MHKPAVLLATTGGRDHDRRLNFGLDIPPGTGWGGIRTSCGLKHGDPSHAGTCLGRGTLTKAKSIVPLMKLKGEICTRSELLNAAVIKMYDVPGLPPITRRSLARYQRSKQQNSTIRLL